MVKENIAIGIIALLLGVGYHLATKIPPNLGMTQVSPTLYVDLLSLLMVACGVLCLIKGAVSHFTTAKTLDCSCETTLGASLGSAAENTSPPNAKSSWRPGPAIAVIVIAAVYAFAMYYVGFIIASFFAAQGVLLAMGRRKPLTLVLVPGTATAAMYVMFGVFLKILLPVGIIFQ